MKKNKSLVCDICGVQSARMRKITRSYGKGADLIIVENVPVISCSHCGESYLEPDTVRAIEKIKHNRKRLTRVRKVPVASLG